MRQGLIFEALGVTLILLGLAFVCFSSFYIDGNLPVTVVLDVIGHYLVGIAVGVVLVAVGVLMIFITKRAKNKIFPTCIKT